MFSYLTYYHENNKWKLESTLSYSIIGGRDGGYRGYSYKNSLKEGEWKVQVVNERGQILGQRKFKIKIVKEVPKLQTDLW